MERMKTSFALREMVAMVRFLPVWMECGEKREIGSAGSSVG